MLDWLRTIRGLLGFETRTEAQTAETEPMPESKIRHTDYSGRIILDQPVHSFESRAVVAEDYDRLSFRPDLVADGWSTDQYCVRAASVRGDSHRYGGMARQDEFALAHHPRSGAVVATVADGVSAAPESHLGAARVCRYATAFVLRALDRDEEPDWAELLAECAWDLVELAKHQIGRDADVKTAEERYATTLTVAMIVPSTGISRLTVVGVGDTAVWLLRGNTLAHLSGGKESVGAEPFTTRVAALPRRREPSNVVRCEVKSSDAILLMSDGIGDPLGDGSGLLGELLRTELRSPPPLLQFARVVDFSRKTFTDDRTLVGIWSNGRNPGSKQ